MMKLWSRMCFLVLAILGISRGQNGTVPTNTAEDVHKIVTPTTSVVLSTDENETETPNSTLRNTSVNTTDPAVGQPGVKSEEEITSSNTTTEASSSTVAQLTTSASTTGGKTTTRDVTTVSVTTGSTSPSPVTIEAQSSSSWGYVILVLIILVIIILCVILYFLRRVSRTYSFDLQRPSPISRLNEPTGTFEPVYLDDLPDLPVLKDDVTTDDISPPPVANGTSLPSEEKGSSGDIAPVEQPDENSVEASPVSNTSPTSADDLADKAPSPSTSATLFFEVLGEEQQNENNNNPSVCSTDPFVEINLDEPALCDQLLTSPEATSSVLPFSPFSFSSSSSSS